MVTDAHAMSLETTAVSDGELVSRAIAGREESFEELVRRYQRPIVAYLYRLVGDYEAALDLTQDVFIKIYKSLDRYSSDFRFSTWIYRIAHNTAIDYLRRTPARQQELRDSEVTTYDAAVTSEAPSPEEESERAERRAELEQVVSRLPRAYRELIALRHGHDMGYDEIAELTGLPLGTVKNRIFRAREALRQLLAERGVTRI